MSKVMEVNELISHIALGAKEQATAIEHVNLAVNEMDKVTQQNAAMVESSTTASHTLSHEANQLESLVSEFTVGGSFGERPQRNERVRPAA